MRIIVNVSKKTLLIIGFCCMTGLLILTAIPIIEMQKTKDYIKVQGTITAAETTVEYGSSNIDSGASIVKLITCRYRVDGKEYEHTYRTFFRLGKKVNSSCTVYCNPDHPERVRDKFMIECCILGIGICLVFLLFVILAVRQM